MMDKIDKKFYFAIKKEKKNINKKYYEKVNHVLEVLPHKKDKKNNLKYLKLSFATICCSCILTTGVVFAKDIGNYLKKLFPNSTKAINYAVENGYVQNVDMDYVYDNDIGIKINHLILDDLNMDISFCYEVQNKNIDSIRFEQYGIWNEKKDLIYEYETESKATVGLAHSMSWALQPIKLTDTTFQDSILLELRKKESDFDKLYFQIKSLRLNYVDGTFKIINGNWKFDIAVSEEMKKSNNFYYNMNQSNNHIKSCTGILSATGMRIEINLAKPILDPAVPIKEGEDLFSDWWSNAIVLKNEDKVFMPATFEMGVDYFILKYDNVGIFFENIENFELYIAPFGTTIILEKEV